MGFSRLATFHFLGLFTKNRANCRRMRRGGSPVNCHRLRSERQKRARNHLATIADPARNLSSRRRQRLVCRIAATAFHFSVAFCRPVDVGGILFHPQYQRSSGFAGRRPLSFAVAVAIVGGLGRPRRPQGLDGGKAAVYEQGLTGDVVGSGCREQQDGAAQILQFAVSADGRPLCQFVGAFPQKHRLRHVGQKTIRGQWRSR